MSVSITDTPGPIHHRKNGMIACILINTIMAVVTGFAAPILIYFGVVIVGRLFYYFP